MKFLVDSCAGRLVADWLRQMGHDVVHAPTLGPDPGDPSLLDLAADQGRVVVTLDHDYGTLIFHKRSRHSGLIRLPDVTPAERIRLLERVLTHHLVDLQARAVVTVRGPLIRVTRP